MLATLSTTSPVPGDTLRLTIDGSHPDDRRAGPRAGHGRGPPHLRQDVPPELHGARRLGRGRRSQQRAGPRPGHQSDLRSRRQFVGGISQANYQALLNNPNDPLLDRTIQGQYAPGSTFKLITATAGLQTGLITPNTRVRRHGQHHHRQLRRPQRQRRRLRRHHPSDRHHGVERQLLQHHRPQPVVRPGHVRRRRPPERGQGVRPRGRHRDRPAQRGAGQDPDP